MNLYLSEKLKALRKEQGISQEKLAQYLNISFQAVSKWETGVTTPDISLLPDIARFYGITVDELLQVEKIDEDKLYKEYEEKACDMYRNGKRAEVLTLWQEAYQKMPRNIEVKEMLMSTYYDVDVKQYQKEIIELGMEIYNSDAHGYYKGQAISALTSVYLEMGNDALAEQWIKKATSIFNSQEVLYTRMSKGDELIVDVSFCNHWFLQEMYYGACAVIKKGGKDAKYEQSVLETVTKIFETVYRNDDMGFEELKKLAHMHLRIARYEAQTTKHTDIIRGHLERAKVLAEKSLTVREHTLSAPMIDGWHINAAPSDHKRICCFVRKELHDACFDAYKEEPWFLEIITALDALS